MGPVQDVSIVELIDRKNNGMDLSVEGREDGLTDPPDGIGDKFVAPARVECFGRADQAHVAFGNEVGQGQPPAVVFACDADNKTQVGRDETIEGFAIAFLCGLEGADFFFPAQRGVFADVFEIEIGDTAVSRGLFGFHKRGPIDMMECVLYIFINL